MRSMFILALRSAWRYRGQFLISMMALVMGMGFVAGGMSFNDGLTKQYESYGDSATYDWYVDASPRLSDKASGRSCATGVTIDECLLTNGYVGYERWLGNGIVYKALSSADPITQTTTISTPKWDTRLAEGAWPERSGEVVVDRTMARKAGASVGSSILVQLDSGLYTMKVTGIAQEQLNASIFFSTEDAERNFTYHGVGLKKADAAAQVVDGPKSDEAAKAVSSAKDGSVVDPSGVYGDGVAIRSMSDQRRVIVNHYMPGLRSIVGVVNGCMLLAVLASLLVVYQGFAVVVGSNRRTYQLAAVAGFTPRMVRGVAMLQAVVFSVPTALLAVVFGAGVLGTASSFFRITQARLEPGAVAACVALVLAASMLSAFVPAWRVSRMEPLEYAVQPDERVSWRRTGAGAVVFIGSLCALLAGYGSVPARAGTAWLALWCVVGASGLLLMAPAMLHCACDALYSLSRRRGGSGGHGEADRVVMPAAFIAGADVRSHLSFFTAAVVSLALSMGLLNAVSMYGATSRAAQTGNPYMPSSIVVAGSTSGTVPSVAVDVLRSEGYTVVEAVRSYEDMVVDGSQEDVGLDERLGLGDGEVAVSAGFARDHGLSVGDRIVVQGHTLTISKVGASSGYSAYVSAATAESFGHADVSRVFVEPPADGASDGVHTPEEVRKVAANVSLLDKQWYRNYLGFGSNAVSLLIYAPMSVGLTVGIFGLMNTLALGVRVRRRELSLIRLAGYTNKQMRRILMLEGGLVSLVGTVVGVVGGTVIGWFALRALGTTTIAMDWGQSAWLCVCAVLFGVCASAVPGGQLLRQLPLEGYRDAD